MTWQKILVVNARPFCLGRQIWQPAYFPKSVMASTQAFGTRRNNAAESGIYILYCTDDGRQRLRL
jgi:hypothetical protein